MGSGGREDALAWRLRQSPSCDALIAAPGNPGIARWAECVAVDPCDAAAVIDLAQTRGINLVVVGPEAPLVAGVADALREAGIATFGPGAEAAQLEGSKGFTKDLCARAGIPTAAYVRVERMAEAMAALDRFTVPVVIKADGLAAGKGVTVATSRAEAEAAIRAAGDGPMVVEEFLDGEEASLFALVDGARCVVLASAQDHKRVGEGDTGPNTGGMGAYSPAPVLTSDLEARAMREIVEPTARVMAEAEAAIRAAGEGPMVIEEFLEGEEASLFALVNGERCVVLASAQDHKRVGEGDTGPNTGGMGAYSPAPVLTPELEARAMDEIVAPTARALAEAGTPFSGILYAGLMLTADGPKLIEYNVRFGDPECEAIMPRVEGDFAELLHAVATGRLADIERPELSPCNTMTVIIAARGYPGAPVSGGAIRAIEAAEQVEGVTVFHAGTATGTDDGIVAKGGRVLAVTARGDTLTQARARAYRAIDQIDFADGFHRRDIGWRELERSGS